LFSAAQAASRVVTGAVSEAALSWKLPWFCGYLSSGRKGLARPAFLVVASIVSAAAHFSLAIATTEEGFALGVTLSGIAFGMVWPLMVLITGEVFGTLHVGANYMFFDGFSSAAGTLLLSKFVAQTVYDEHINENHGDPVNEGNYKCFGTGCFQLSHLIVSVLSLTCILSSAGLIWTTKDVYRRS
jgi:MFS family permease